MASSGVEAIRKKGYIHIDCIDRVDHCGNWNPRSAERPITGVIVGTRAVGVKTTGVVKGIDFVSQHSNHRSDPIHSTSVPKVEAILLRDVVEGNNCLYWRIARPLDENGQEQGISCRSNRNVPRDNCYSFWND